MEIRPRSAEETYAPAWELARAALAALTPEVAAARAAVQYRATTPAAGRFEVPFWGQSYQVEWPGGEVALPGAQGPAPVALRLLLLHYLTTADGTPLASHWASFREMPGGLGYWAAFEGRATLRLAHRFGSDRQGFIRAGEELGGERLTFGDASFAFRVLPRLWVAVVLHLADEEFGANANLLFDGAASHYLPTEDLAVLGGMVASRLIRAAGR